MTKHFIKVGDTFSNNKGHVYTVTEHAGSTNIGITFEETGYTTYASADRVVKGGIKDPYQPSVFNVGIIGEEELTYISEDGSKKPYLFYKTWSRMLKRTYDSSRKSHEGLTVAKEWHSLSNYKTWYNENYVEGYELNMDILVPFSSEYSPETCVFVPGIVNMFFNGKSSSRNEYLPGILFARSNKKGLTYTPIFNDPFTNKKVYMGSYSSELEAHLAWKEKKHETANKLADMFEGVLDKKVIDAMRIRYAHTPSEE